MSIDPVRVVGVWAVMSRVADTLTPMMRILPRTSPSQWPIRLVAWTPAGADAGAVGVGARLNGAGLAVCRGAGVISPPMPGTGRPYRPGTVTMGTDIDISRRPSSVSTAERWGYVITVW